MDKNDVTLEGLRALGLTRQESLIYLELLQKPATHAQLSLTTGINRTTIYRLAEKLEKRGLITKGTGDLEKSLMAADPSTLETEVVTQEIRAKNQRAVLGRLLPALDDIKKGYEADFAVRKYEGTEGFKQMLWHELKAKGDCLCIGQGALQELIGDEAWAEKHRRLTIEAGYRILEVLNPEQAPNQYFSQNKNYLDNYYEMRWISPDILPINHLMTVYNDTVATYHLQNGRRIGLEIVSKPYAETMRRIFRTYWEMGDKPSWQK